MSGFSRFNEDFSRFDEPPLRNRGRVIRMAVFYSFWAGLSGVLVAMALYKVVSGDSGLLVMLMVFGFFGLLTAYHANQYLRDVKARPVVHEGDIMRKWHKGNLLFFLLPSFYIMVQGKIYSVTRQEYALLLEDDLVRITCYPHSLTVERLELYDSSYKQFVPATGGATG